MLSMYPLEEELMMKAREFEQYSRNQLVINLSLLAVLLSCSASILVMLKSLT